jgi:hypothetical protein
VNRTIARSISKRRIALFQRFWSNKWLVVVTERGMGLMDGLFRRDEFGLIKLGLVEEDTTLEEYKSSDPERDRI